MALSSSSCGVLGLPRATTSSGDTGDAITISPLLQLLFPTYQQGDNIGDGEGEGDGVMLMLPLKKKGLSDTPMRSSSFFAACRRSCSLKFGFFLGPIISVVVGLLWVRVATRDDGRVRGSFSADASSGAPVSFWTTSLKFDGSAWTKVVLPIVGSDPKEVGECMPVLEAMTTVREREGDISEVVGLDWRGS